MAQQQKQKSAPQPEKKDQSPLPQQPSQEKELTDQLQRLQAEFQNYQKRIEKEKHDIVEYGIADFIKQLIPLVEDLEKHIQQHQEDNPLAMIYKNVKKVLESHGLREMDSINRPFDPYQHEVITKVSSDQPEGIIVSVIQKGYFFKGRVLRHAKVQVSNGIKPEVSEA